MSISSSLNIVPTFSTVGQSVLTVTTSNFVVFSNSITNPQAIVISQTGTNPSVELHEGTDYTVVTTPVTGVNGEWTITLTLTTPIVAGQTIYIQPNIPEGNTLTINGSSINAAQLQNAMDSNSLQIIQLKAAIDGTIPPLQGQVTSAYTLSAYSLEQSLNKIKFSAIISATSEIPLNTQLAALSGTTYYPSETLYFLDGRAFTSGGDYDLTFTIDQNGFVILYSINNGITSIPIGSNIMLNAEWGALIGGVTGVPVGVGAAQIAFTPTANNPSTTVQTAIEYSDNQTQQINKATQDALATKVDKVNGASEMTDSNAYPTLGVPAGSTQETINSGANSSVNAANNLINGLQTQITSLENVLPLTNAAGLIASGTIPPTNVQTQVPMTFNGGSAPSSIVVGGNLVVPANAAVGSSIQVSGAIVSSGSSPTSYIRFYNLTAGVIISNVISLDGIDNLVLGGNILTVVASTVPLVDNERSVHAGDVITLQGIETNTGEAGFDITSSLTNPSTYILFSLTGGTIVSVETGQVTSSGVNNFIDGTALTSVLNQMQEPATATTSGIVSTGNQSFSGTKQFTSIGISFLAPYATLVCGADPDNIVSGVTGSAGYVLTSNGTGSLPSYQAVGGAPLQGGSVSWSLNGGSVNFSSLGKTGNEVNLGFSVNYAGGVGSGTQFGILPNSHRINPFYSTSGEGGSGVAPNFKYFASRAPSQNVNMYSLFWIYNFVDIQNQAGMSSNGEGQIRTTNSWIHG